MVLAFSWLFCSAYALRSCFKFIMHDSVKIRNKSTFESEIYKQAPLIFLISSLISSFALAAWLVVHNHLLFQRCLMLWSLLLQSVNLLLVVLSIPLRYFMVFLQPQVLLLQL